MNDSQLICGQMESPMMRVLGREASWLNEVIHSKEAAGFTPVGQTIDERLLVARDYPDPHLFA